MLKENAVSRRGFIATGASALLMLTGCNGRASKATKAPTQTVSITIGNTNKVLLDIPKSWTVDTESDGSATIIPDGFDGIVSLGSNFSPMSTFTSDEEVLAFLEQTFPEINGEWTLVSKKKSAAPIYEAPVQLSGGKKGRGYMRAAISGEDTILVEAIASKDDWSTAKGEIKEVLSTYRLDDPQEPEYSEPLPKDVFTIVSATRAKELGYGFWQMDVTVKNNSNEAKQFLGFQIDELNADGNIISSYMSYNKNANYAVVEPGQTYTIELTEAIEDNIAGMQSRYCEWGDSPSTAIKSEYSTPFKQMF